MGLIDVYTAAQDSVHTYRIPALAVTRQGTLLAFAEARQTGAGEPLRPHRWRALLLPRARVGLG